MSHLNEAQVEITEKSKDQIFELVLKESKQISIPFHYRSIS